MTIKIYKPTKSSMQSGLGRTKLWLAEYISDSDNVKESLMGWNSSLDTKEQIKIFFDTKEQAIEWSIKNNQQFIVVEPKERKIKPKTTLKKIILRPRQNLNQFHAKSDSTTFSPRVNHFY